MDDIEEFQIRPGVESRTVAGERFDRWNKQAPQECKRVVDVEAAIGVEITRKQCGRARTLEHPDVIYFHALRKDRGLVGAAHEHTSDGEVEDHVEASVERR